MNSTSCTAAPYSVAPFKHTPACRSTQQRFRAVRCRDASASHQSSGASVSSSFPIPRVSAFCFGGSVSAAAMQYTLSPAELGCWYFIVGHSTMVGVQILLIFFTACMVDFRSFIEAALFTSALIWSMASVACRSLLTSYKMLQALPAAKLAALTCTLVVFTRIVSVALFGGALVPFAIAAWQRHRIEMSKDAETEADFAEFDGKLGSKA